MFGQPYAGNRVWVMFIRENKFWKETFEIAKRKDLLIIQQAVSLLQIQ